MIHISTHQLYDGPSPHPEADVHLKNCYAFSKSAGELAVAGEASTVLRTNCFGRSLRPGRASFSDWLVGALRRLLGNWRILRALLLSQFRSWRPAAS